MSTDPSLLDQSQAFAAELKGLLQSAIPATPDVKVEVAGHRVVIGTESPIPLAIKGAHRATLSVRLRCELDSRGAWLAVEGSSFVLTAVTDRTPVFRFEYLRRPKTVPCAHLQVHAHRGALSELLTHGQHPKAHDMSALHIPVGGARFRPCLEDVVQLLAEDFRFDMLPTWRAAVNPGREEWRRKQVRAAVRDWQEEAAETLRKLGYSVTAPEEVHQPADVARFGW